MFYTHVSGRDKKITFISTQIVGTSLLPKIFITKKLVKFHKIEEG